jgi:hypothetical protein
MTASRAYELRWIKSLAAAVVVAIVSLLGLALIALTEDHITTTHHSVTPPTGVATAATSNAISAHRNGDATVQVLLGYSYDSAVGNAPARNESAAPRRPWPARAEPNARSATGQRRLRSLPLVAAGEGTAGSISNVNVLGGTENCVNCVIAGDATLSGSPASALNSVGPQPISILEEAFGGTFKEVAGQGELGELLNEAGPLLFGGHFPSQ